MDRKMVLFVGQITVWCEMCNHSEVKIKRVAHREMELTLAHCFMAPLTQKKSQVRAARQDSLELLCLSKAVSGHQAVSAKNTY